MLCTIARYTYVKTQGVGDSRESAVNCVGTIYVINALYRAIKWFQRFVFTQEQRLRVQERHRVLLGNTGMVGNPQYIYCFL